MKKGFPGRCSSRRSPSGSPVYLLDLLVDPAFLRRVVDLATYGILYPSDFDGDAGPFVQQLHDLDVFLRSSSLNSSRVFFFTPSSPRLPLDQFFRDAWPS